MKPKVFGVGRFVGLILLLGYAPFSGADVQDLSTATKVDGPKLYFQENFGLLYNNPSWSSEGQDVLACNERVATIIYPQANLPEGWVRAKIRGKEGFIPRAFLAEKKARCFAEKYPKFYDRFNLSATERFYWGRLMGRYLWGDTTLP